ncbi:STAS domain-containing protein [Sphingomonas sp. TREG-RG-20F-R18-01]|uniref:STAS domain-containing protein n=1 Tax=Sphingomonas sp. TREG-RG-20F-R18-01 TaxID=2914982 RepID=UPI001F5A16C5|nr:STAS domain-containing protein [Sphingomonas sp. TREG-RG-20F-R18-01]
MTQIVLVPAIVTTATVSSFAAELGAHLEQNDAVELDVTEVADADVSCLQLICAARHQAERDGKGLRLAHPANDAVAMLLERAGFLTDIAPADQMFWFHGDLPQ